MSDEVQAGQLAGDRQPLNQRIRIIKVYVAVDREGDFAPSALKNRAAAEKYAKTLSEHFPSMEPFTVHLLTKRVRLTDELVRRKHGRSKN